MSAVAFFSELSTRALARSRAAPELVRVDPLVGRGWLLEYRLQDANQSVELNALVAEGESPSLEFSYRVPPADVRRPQHLRRVCLLLCKALARSSHGELPELVLGHGVARQIEREDLQLYLPGDCDRGCVFCSRSLERARERSGLRQPRPTLPVLEPAAGPAETVGRAEVEARLRARSDRAAEIHVGWSGKDCLSSPLFDASLRLAHELGYRDMSVQTPGSRLLEPDFIEFLRAHGVRHVGLTAHAHSEAVFDRVGGKVGAYRNFWAAFEALLEADFELSLEVPCVAATVDELADHLANLAGYPCPITCFYWYPSADMNHQFADIGVSFEEAIAVLDAARERLAPGRVAVDGIPACMAPASLVEHYRWDYGTHISFIDFERIEACAGCGLSDDCPGVAPLYGEHHRLPEPRTIVGRAS